MEPIEPTTNTSTSNSTFGSSGTTRIDITRGDGATLKIQGTNSTNPGATAQNIKVDGTPDDLWRWITDGGQVKVASNGAQIFSTSNMTYAYYPAASSTNRATITVFDKVLKLEWLKIRF